MMIMDRILVFLNICTFNVLAGHIGLFSSTGAYSHDVMMRNLADRLTSTDGHHVTIVQIRVFEFNRTFPAARAHWDHVIFSHSEDESASSVQRESQTLMWYTTVPFDGDTLDPRSMWILDKIQSAHMRACSAAVRDQRFISALKKLDLDLLVIDHVLNDCAIGLAHSLWPTVRVVYMSNYPLVSCYMEALAVPSNPSYVPSAMSKEKLPMNFSRRALNTFLHALLLLTRIRYYNSASRTFKAAGDIHLPSMTNLERRMLLMYATPFEMMIDVARPMVTGLRYFGCDHCWDDFNEAGNVTKELSIPHITGSIILVSFGTVTNGDLIPLIQLQRFLRVFSQFPHYTIVWQLDASKEYYQRAVRGALNTTSLPSHIHIVPWLPLRRLLSDPRVILLISHGGVTTCLEAVSSAVPVLGIAIQGDQMYNLQRLVEKGVGEFMQVTKLREDVLHRKLERMVQENKRYKKAAVKLRLMLHDYKTLQKVPSSVFWLSWAVRHFGSKEWNRTGRVERIYSSRHSSNWAVYYSMDTLIATVIIGGLTAYILFILN